MKTEKPEEIKLEVPKGIDPIDYLEEYFGVDISKQGDIPDGADVNGQVIIKFN